ncbi:hypothetical protein PG999_000240 [Apiospora kogelbergensis]|uniref:Uncharacterized protein n=1 Tax=Apiospora kogelbergensis TaxID=1337665 RepID=A0AAW0RB75_9PEZI
MCTAVAPFNQQHRDAQARDDLALLGAWGAPGGHSLGHDDHSAPGSGLRSCSTSLIQKNDPKYELRKVMIRARFGLPEALISR